MLQSFEATLKNGQIIWKDSLDKLPNEAEVVITVLEVKKQVKSSRKTLDFLSEPMLFTDEENAQIDAEFNEIHDSWQRDIL
ncbi:MAG: hypothetical protein MUF45_10745 [Spirosomaceae bacterium]|jgi:hypothetical protein|nr:hypothetical protein [Spirosomataceae bacterium]